MTRTEEGRTGSMGVDAGGKKAPTDAKHLVYFRMKAPSLVVAADVRQPALAPAVCADIACGGLKCRT